MSLYISILLNLHCCAYNLDFLLYYLHILCQNKDYLFLYYILYSNNSRWKEDKEYCINYGSSQQVYQDYTWLHQFYLLYTTYEQDKHVVNTCPYQSPRRRRRDQITNRHTMINRCHKTRPNEQEDWEGTPEAHASRKRLIIDYKIPRSISSH